MKDFIKAYKEHFHVYHWSFALCYVLFLDRVPELAAAANQEVITTAIAYMLYIAIEALIAYTVFCIMYHILDKYADK